MTSFAYLNGRLVPETDAWVTIDDGGWLHGAGLFETMRAEHGRIFRLESHIARLRQSAEALLRPIAQEILPTPADFAALLERNELRIARVRLTVSAGSMRGARRDDAADDADDGPALTVCATVSPLGGYDAAAYRAGMGVVVSPYLLSPSDPLAAHKTTARLSRLLGLRAARAAGCDEALWFTTGHHLADGCVSNVFVVRGGVLKTPPVDTPVLPGIARGVVLELAADRDIEAQQCALTIDDVLDADEVFLTNAIMQVMPVVRVEKRSIKDGQVGPIASRLLEAYRDIVQRECAGG